MPWRESGPMDQRRQLVEDYRSGLFSMTELAEQYHVSRKTGYKWVDRSAAATDGVLALADRSRRPHTSPCETAPAVVAALIAMRKRHPRWGARKLIALGHQQHAALVWPSRSTVCDLLTRAGLVKARPRPRPAVGHRPSVLGPMVAPNQTWTTDFKGEFRTADRRVPLSPDGARWI